MYIDSFSHTPTVDCSLKSGYSLLFFVTSAEFRIKNESGTREYSHHNNKKIDRHFFFIFSEKANYNQWGLAIIYKEKM